MVLDFIEKAKPFELHVVFSISSGLLLIIAGAYLLYRKKESMISRFFSLFYMGLGLYQIFDGVFTFFYFISKNLFLANLSRDLSLMSLVAGLNFGALSVLVIYYGQEKVFQKQLLLGDGILLLFMFLGAVFGDYSTEFVPKVRTPFGWIAIIGAFILFSFILVAFIILLMKNSVVAVRNKLLQLLVGYLILVITLFAFDISFLITDIQVYILANPYYHFLMHVVALLGGFIMLLTLVKGFK